MHFSFSDYDHENERHVELEVMPGLCVSIERRVETNAIDDVVRSRSRAFLDVETVEQGTDTFALGRGEVG